jgi:uncharacterized protein YbdZ (MbtH family)
MTIDQVLDEARRIEPAQRVARWSGCGTHDAGNLLVAESAEGACWRYCEACWTAFDMTGAYAVNAPAVLRMEHDAAPVSRVPMFTVIANCEDEFTVWPLAARMPHGWRSGGTIGTAEQCARFITEIDGEPNARVLRRRLERGVMWP